MKRSAPSANSSLIETTNNPSPKRSCIPRNKLCLESDSGSAACSSAAAAASTSSDGFSPNEEFTIEDHIESLVCMGFIDRAFNRQALRRANNDISEAITILTSCNYFDDDASERCETTTFIDSLTKEQVEQQTVDVQSSNSNGAQSTTSDETTSNEECVFTTSAFLDLETKVYGDNWSIPYKRDEPLGRCLLSATKLALAGTADQDKHCLKFMEDLIPEAFHKLQCTHNINNWGLEVQAGVFDMVELLVDLIAARLSYAPVPVRLLETLAILFDADSIFQRKHRTKAYDRSLYEKQLGDRALANPPSTSTFSVYNRSDPFGWLCQIINRFVLKDGLSNLKAPFRNEKPLNASEYNALLAPFVHCMDYVFHDKYRQLFSEHIEQASNYISNLQDEDCKAKSANTIFHLISTLRKICSAVWASRLEQIEHMHLSLLLKMIALPNFNAKMNSLKELAKVIENATSNIQSTAKQAIRRDTIIEWIIKNSILSKALEGNIDQNQYVEKVRIIMDFIAPRILKEDIETIWKMQHGRSLVAVDHLFTLIASAAAKFNLEQLNHLIDFIYESWKTERVLIREKLIELLGAIGRECQKDSAARVLETLWTMAHENRLDRSMLDHLLHCHLRIFSEGRCSYDSLKRDYCLKCVADLQRKQGWLVPAINHLYDLLRHDPTHTLKRTDQDLVTLLVNKHDIVSVLIQSLSTCQLDVWNKTHGHVTIDTLVDGCFTHEESIKSHLDLLSFLLKRGNLYLILKRSEELWETLITNERASSFDRELGLNWFITCVEDLNPDSQVAVFRKHVLKLDPLHLTTKGYACFTLYFERDNFQRQSPSKNSTHSSSAAPSAKNRILNYHGMEELWNIILCVDDDCIANEATRFLLDLYYTKQPDRTRRSTAKVLHEYFLKDVYARLSHLLVTAVPSSSTSTHESDELYKVLKTYGEQLSSASVSPVSQPVDHELWSQKIERLLAIAEDYIHLVEHEHSPAGHIASFHGLEYQIKLVLADSTKVHCPYDIAIVHSNDTLERLRIRLGQFYKVSSQDTHLSIQNTGVSAPLDSHTKPLDSSMDAASSSTNSTILGLALNSKYLYEIHVTSGTTVYIKFAGNTHHQPVPSGSSEPTRIYLTDTPSRFNLNENDDLSTPSNIMGDNLKLYDVLYKLSFLREEPIQKRIRNLLCLMPSDSRVRDHLDQISLRATDAQQVIEQVFLWQTCSSIQLLYNLEVLSSRIYPLSTNDGIIQSSKLFRQDFVKQSGVKYLFQLLQSMHLAIDDHYQYSLCQEMIMLILQLLKLLLCGKVSREEAVPSSLPTPIASSAMAYSIKVNEHHPTAIEWDFRSTIEHAVFEDFVEHMKQFIFLCWAAAAGNLRLHGPKLRISEPVRLDRHAVLEQINSNVFCRNNSRLSVSNESSIESKTVRFGICLKKSSISPMDSEIAQNLIEIITLCFEKRSEFLATFLVEPFFADFLLEILIGTTSREVRQCALRHIVRLCGIKTSVCDIRSIIHQIILKAQLPLWVSSIGGTRSSNQKLLSQSIEYFHLRCHLTEHLTGPQQAILGINAKELLAEELNWLANYAISSTSTDLRTIDNVLFLGHLKFIRTLLTCEHVDKKQCGADLIRLLIDQFLFPASRRIALPMQTLAHEMMTTDESVDESAPEPKCSTNESRLAAYDVLVELVRHCPANLQTVVDDLIHLHHRLRVEKQTEWEFMPQVNPRASCGLVGLYNGGATCYMNSILQQLFMLPQISEYILSIQDDGESAGGTARTDDSNLFYQLQQAFGHLLESKMQYYSPESFWNVFRLWGQEINVREQQDAFDFFTALTDQIDEYLKSTQRDEIFHKQFEGIFCNQMICTNGCSHRYEGEEKFMALNVAVKVDSLKESLNQFVKGELLDGSNAYFCAKCQEKRTTIKRLCIKKLPPLLCIQMKRFGFDWENNRALKFDDYFQFPLILNMEPYTLEGVNKRENSVQYDELIASAKDHSNGDRSKNSSANTNGASKSFSRSSSSSNYSSPSQSTINYELIGIVVHSGQANAGHYYSFIRDTRAHHANKWYRFNDTTVDEIQLTEQMLEEECFGGTFRVQKDNAKSNDERIRSWNAYILIYQCIQPLKLLPPPSMPAARSFRRARSHQRDSLSQLADLVVQSEHNDLFQVKKTSVPSRVLACVKDENLEFLKHRDTYCDDYFQWISKLSSICFDEDLAVDQEDRENHSLAYELCTKLALHFLLNTHLRTHRRLRKDDLKDWVDLLARLFERNPSSCTIFYQLVFEFNENSIKLYLLDCPIDDIRQVFKQLCEHALHSTYAHAEDENNRLLMRKFIKQFILLLDKSVVEQVKQSQAYFQLLHTYVIMNENAIEYLLKMNTLKRLMNFLLGENIDSRRWNSGQAKDFGVVHEIISMLVLSCYANEDKFPERMSELNAYFYEHWSTRYFRELCYAFQEIPSAQLIRTSLLIETLSTSNQLFAEQAIRHMVQSIAHAHTNDFKSLSRVLSQILLIKDSFQCARLQLAFEGVDGCDGSDHCRQNFHGLYSLIQTSSEADQRRAYQTVKFLITLSNKSTVCKDYFSSNAVQWESAIQWLKQQMQPSWQSSPAQNISNEDTDARSFQRTRSAQYTLEQAQCLLQRTASPGGYGQNDTSSSESMEINDSRSPSSSQSTLAASD